MEDSFDSPSRLAVARAAASPGSSTPHTVVVLPSYSVSESLLAHYGHRIPSLEHRQLLSLLTLPRAPGAEIIFVTCRRPARRVIDYYLSLVPPELRNDMRTRIKILEIPDQTPRSIAIKLLDRPDLLARIRRMTRNRVAFIEPWNVTAFEMEIAQQLDMPINGTVPELWPLGFKSNGRRIMRSAGVPLPIGREDVRSVDEVVAAAEAVRLQHPTAAGVVVKSDNSGTGDGNHVLRFGAGHRSTADLRSAVRSWEPWYLADLARGAVVEELIDGAGFASPSVQVDISPGHRVEVLSTHEQVLGGADGQVYVGCQFPANPGYSSLLASYGGAVGTILADRGAMGRFCVDFATVPSADGGWDVYGLEINLRKSGTTHPLWALQSLAPGRYDTMTGRWRRPDGSARCYRSTDNLVDPAWCGRPLGEVIEAVRRAGLEFDRGTETGVVLHMFNGLDIDGRLGLTAIGSSPAHSEDLYAATTAALCAPAARSGVPLPA